MPATEQFWRNIKVLHLVFGLSGLAMLGATLWMFAADNNREWKQYQRTFRKIEAWTADSQINETESKAYRATERQLEQKLADAQAAKPDVKLVDQFLGEADSRAEQNGYDLKPVETARTSLEGASTPAEVAKRRNGLVNAMQTVERRAKFVEDNFQRTLKFKRANLDSRRSFYDLAVSGGMPESVITSREQEAKKLEKEVNDLTLNYQDSRSHREKLDRHLAAITKDEAVAKKVLDEHRRGLQRLETALSERRLNAAEQLITLPIIDAFGRPLKIDQLWLPQLTLNNNFRDVARFDRCTTCHQGMEKTAPGTAIDPAYEPTHRVRLTLATPEKPPAAEPGPDGKTTDPTLSNVYGMELAKTGLLDPDDVTVNVVWPEGLASKARPADLTNQPTVPSADFELPEVGLHVGDVIEQIGDVIVRSPQAVRQYLLESVQWGKPISLSVRRGVPQPFSTHPRLDLFVGSQSPHQMQQFGCTICHQGQGSATDFKWASHTPNTPRQMEDWNGEHGWFNNHHWIYPMYAQRFTESTCIKCHHNVTELEPSSRFPEPPAPKVVRGYHLIRQYGCFGCHEINGFDGPNKRIGPDLRAEPNYFAAAQQVLADGALPNDARSLAMQVVSRPEDTAARKRLAEILKSLAPAGAAQPATVAAAAATESNDAAKEAAKEAAPKDSANKPQIAPATLSMAGILGADDETPGQLRRVGPSLRHVDKKVDLEFLVNWIRKPSDFRPSTKMPQFFGLWDHLVDEPVAGEHGAAGKHSGRVVMGPSPGRQQSERLEPVEVRAIAEYLLDASAKQPFEYIEKPAEVTEDPDAARGKLAFETRGCLACHQHPDFPAGKATQGPNLQRLGAKLHDSNGARWLYSWLRSPSNYHARTLMPNLFLEPIKLKQKGEGDQTREVVVDPAADITVYLLQSKDWKPAPVPKVVDKDLDELAMLYLGGAFTQSDSKRYLENGIPNSLATELKGDETLLVGEGEMSQHKKLLYVGRRTITRLGCAACHDVPGFEDAKPIGTGLNDWGLKEPAKLAFEQVVNYLAEKLPAEASKPGEAPAKGAMSHGSAAQGVLTQGADYGSTNAPEGTEHAELNPHELGPDTGFFVDAMLNHEREGFLWQKLREPRSYDYKKTENKSYIERLRMPKFTAFDDADREAIMTFVLGLVATPPVSQYVYHPNQRQEAVLAGQRTVEKFNCGGCHTLRMDKWGFDYDPATFENPPAFNDYAFLMPHFSPEQLEASKKVDKRGLGHATVTGMPNPEQAEDDEGHPQFFFGLWEPTPINGKPWLVGDQEVTVASSSVTRQHPPEGGDLARLLHPVAFALGQKGSPELGIDANPNVKATDVWGWLPPPLVREGEKVQPEWLNAFLLDPYRIRPAAILRMPKFNMSPQEARTLVTFFAARDNAEYPYQFNERKQSEYLESREAEHKNRLGDALKIVTDNNFCIKCHKLGDFTPPGSTVALAPQLDQVYRRLRPGYLEEWIANPKRKLPYTGMPVNFPPDKPAPQQLYAGKSQEQLEAIVDLLLNWDVYMKNQTPIAPLIKPGPPGEPAPAGAAANGAAANDAAGNDVASSKPGAPASATSGNAAKAGAGLK